MMKEKTLDELCPYNEICEVEHGDDYICKYDYQSCGFYKFFMLTRELSGGDKDGRVEGIPLHDPKR